MILIKTICLMAEDRTTHGYFKSKNKSNHETLATNPKLNLSLNKGKHGMVGDTGYIYIYIYIYSVSDDRDTSYPDSGPVRDSKEGGPEESDEKGKDGTGEGGLSMDLGEGGGVRQIPIPKHLGHDTGCL